MGMQPRKIISKYQVIPHIKILLLQIYYTCFYQKNPPEFRGFLKTKFSTFPGVME